MSSPEELAEEVLAVFEEKAVQRLVLASDRALIRSDLRDEARPAVHSLVFALSVESTQDEASLEHHEGMAMVNLLGRRAATLGLTPTAAHHLVPTLCEAIASVVAPLPSAYAHLLGASFVEGYVRGVRDHEAEGLMDTLTKSLPTLALGHGIYAIILHGPIDAERIRDGILLWTREIFLKEALGVIVDVSGLSLRDEGCAAAIAEVDPAATIGGAYCAFSGVDEVWRECFARVDPNLALFERFEDALALVSAKSRKKGFFARMIGQKGR